MPQVLQEELSQEVRIKGDISARLCSKVWEINLVLHPDHVWVLKVEDLRLKIKQVETMKCIRKENL